MNKDRDHSSLEKCIAEIESQVKNGADYLVVWNTSWERWGSDILNKISFWIQQMGYKFRKKASENPNAMFAIVAEKETSNKASEKMEVKKISDLDKTSDKTAGDTRSANRNACLSDIIGQMEGSHTTIDVKTKDWQEFTQDIVDLLNHPDIKKMGYSLRKEFCHVIKADGVNYLVFAERYLDLIKEDPKAPEKTTSSLKDGKPIKSKFVCPICGYPDLQQEPFYSYEICDCCGAQFGENDGETDKERFLRRTEWLQRGAPWHLKFQMPGSWKVDPTRAAATQLRNAGLAFPGTGGSTETRFCEVEILVGRIQDASEVECLRTILNGEWSIQDAWIIGKNKNTASYRGRDFLMAGDSERALAERIRNEIWFNMERFLPIKIKIINLEIAPINSFDFLEEEKFKSEFPTKINIKKEEPISEFQEISKAAQTTEIPKVEIETKVETPEQPLPKGQTTPLFIEGDLEEEEEDDEDDEDEDDDSTEPLPLIMIDEDDFEEPKKDSNNSDRNYPFGTPGVH